MKAGFLTTGLVLAALVACAQPETDEPVVTDTPQQAELQWADAEPLPAGARMAVVSGDPGAAGPFTIRLRFPNDYRVPPHTHPAAETITVISGILHVGRGTTFDMAGDITELQTGQSMDAAANAPHFAHAAGDTEIEVQSTGPFEIHYVNPEDDPRS
jgi:quercetin dioxygenase-like cupin family protein